MNVLSDGKGVSLISFWDSNVIMYVYDLTQWKDSSLKARSYLYRSNDT